METKLLEWLKIVGRFLFVIFIIGSIAVSIDYILAKLLTNKPLTEAVVNKSMPDNSDSVLTKIERLEKQIEKQEFLIKRLESSMDAAAANDKQLEKKLQAHTEAFKRLCEYIVVITVDKKIIPRQCLPEYKWAKEEG